MSQSKSVPSSIRGKLKNLVTLADLYPEFSSEEQAEAEYNLKQYAALIWRICQRIKREKS